MFIATLFTIAKAWKHGNNPTVLRHEYIYIYMHAIEYYSAIKRNEIIPFAVTWM